MTDYSKIGKRSRRKGGDYERKICKLLTESTEITFRRAPRSGALMRQGKVNGSWVSGDLTSEKEFKFSIECKNRKNIDLNSIIKNPSTCEWSTSWFQCNYDADKGFKLPLMFFYLVQVKKDYVAVCEHGMNLLESHIEFKSPVMVVKNLVADFSIKIDNEEQRTDKLPDAYVFNSDELKDRDDLSFLFNQE